MWIRLIWPTPDPLWKIHICINTDLIRWSGGALLPWSLTEPNAPPVSAVFCPHCVLRLKCSFRSTWASLDDVNDNKLLWPLNLSVSLSLTNRTLRMLSSLKMMSMSPCTVLKGRFPTYAVNGGSVGSSFCFRGPPGPPLPPPRGLTGGQTGSIMGYRNTHLTGQDGWVVFLLVDWFSVQIFSDLNRYLVSSPS